MTDSCPVPGPDDPLVRSLLGVVDCHTEMLVHSGYSALFQGAGNFSGLLTALLTIYVAFIGYRLMLGQSQMRVTDFALTAVKLGAVLALATQWDTYQALVYRFLFEGPQQLASSMVASIQPEQSSFRGDVFDGLQRAFDDLSLAANGYSSHAAGPVSALMGGAGFAALMLNLSATLLLMSSLGVLLAAKIVLGLLLAVGPLFIALALFDATRGLFEGWLRASLAFAFAPLATIILLAIALTMLEPSLLQVEQLRKQGIFTLGPVYSISTLILVFAGVSAGALVAGGVIAAGFRIPGRSSALPDPAPGEPVKVISSSGLEQPRATRIAAAAAAMERRDSTVMASVIQTSLVDRRTEIASAATRGVPIARDAETRLGQATSRRIRPRTPRPTARSA